MRAAFSTELVRLAKADPSVLLLTGDHGYALFDEFRRECPDQYINCGIAEQNMVGMAAGLAKAGFRPFVYGLAAFIPIRVIEQIKIDIAHDDLPVVMIGDGAGLVYSQLGTSHQSTEDITCTRAIPNLTILSPADRFEMSACIRLAKELGKPVYLRIGKSDLGDVHPGPVNLKVGEMLLVHKGSGRIAMLATGSMVKTALELVDRGFDAEVWSVPSLKPVPASQLDQIVIRVEQLITLEEHSVIGGLGSAVAETMIEKRPLPLCRIGVDDGFTDSCGTWSHLLCKHKIDIDSIRRKIFSFLERNKQTGQSIA
jgi:transketolase